MTHASIPTQASSGVLASAQLRDSELHGEIAHISGGSSPGEIAAVACTSAVELSERLQESQASLRIVGAGTWLDAGRPTQPAYPLHTRKLDGIVEYVPGDLTMTVRAGTPLAELDAITAAEGQWLGIDPAGSAQGTIGATVATASTGPLAHGIGRMRDLVLGLEVVTGDGRITRSGGKVVKNVAGFDLVRLQTGAWGTLGVITEVSIRLRALPELDETVAIVLDVRKPLVAHLVALRDLAVAPLAIELVDGALAERLGVGVSTMLLVRLAGNETRVSAQRLELATLGDSRVVSNNVWQTLRVVDDGSVASVRVSHLPSELSRTWAMVHGELAGAGMSGFLMRATVSRGVVRVVVPSAALAGAGTNALASMVHSLTPPGGHVVWEKLPANAWTGVPSAVGDALSAGLQRAFDRARRCNIGILGTTPS